MKLKEYYNINEYGVFIFHDDKKLKPYVGIYSEDKQRVYLVGINKVYYFDKNKMTDITKGTYKGFEIRKVDGINLLDNKHKKSLTYYVRTSYVAHNTIGAFEYDGEYNYDCSLSVLLKNNARLERDLKAYKKTLKHYKIKSNYFCDYDGDETDLELDQ